MKAILKRKLNNTDSETLYSVTCKPLNVLNGNTETIGDAILNIQSVINLCKSHACKAGHDLKYISHWYYITEWDEDEGIINQTNLEELLYERRI